MFCFCMKSKKQMLWSFQKCIIQETISCSCIHLSFEQLTLSFEIKVNFLIYLMKDAGPSHGVTPSYKLARPKYLFAKWLLKFSCSTTCWIGNYKVLWSLGRHYLQSRHMIILWAQFPLAEYLFHIVIFPYRTTRKTINSLIVSHVFSSFILPTVRLKICQSVTTVWVGTKTARWKFSKDANVSEIWSIAFVLVKGHTAIVIHIYIYTGFCFFFCKSIHLIFVILWMWKRTILENHIFTILFRVGYSSKKGDYLPQ